MKSFFHTLFVMVKKEFQHLLRDKTGLRMLFIMPMAQMLILGYALTTEVKHTPFAIVDHEGSPITRSLIQTISGNPLFTFKGYVNSEEDLREKLDQGLIKVGIILPFDFSKQLIRATYLNPAGQGFAALGEGPKDHGAALQLLIDGQDANSASVSRGYLTLILNGWATNYLKLKLQGFGIRLDQVIPLSISSTVLFNPQLKSTWHMIPGIAVILITMVTALLTGFSIVREKENGTLEQLMVTPIKPVHVVIAKAFPFFCVGLIELMLALAIAQFWFRIPFRGSYFTLIAFSAAYMLSSLGIGIFTSTMARTQQQALFLIWFFTLFFLLLSGFFMPIENMPHWVQTITYLNPVRYFMHILREMFLKGSGFQELWKDGLSLIAIGATVFTFSVLKFNRTTS